MRNMKHLLCWFVSFLVVPRNRQFRWNIELRDDLAHRSEFGCGDVEERAPEGGVATRAGTLLS